MIDILKCVRPKTRRMFEGKCYSYVFYGYTSNVNIFKCLLLPGNTFSKEPRLILKGLVLK